LFTLSSLPSSFLLVVQFQFGAKKEEHSKEQKRPRSFNLTYCATTLMKHKEFGDALEVLEENLDVIESFWKKLKQEAYVRIRQARLGEFTALTAHMYCILVVGSQRMVCR